jgi:hypothetical protein
MSGVLIVLVLAACATAVLAARSVSSAERARAYASLSTGGARGAQCKTPRLPTTAEASRRRGARSIARGAPSRMDAAGSPRATREVLGTALPARLPSRHSPIRSSSWCALPANGAGTRTLIRVLTTLLEQ